MPRQKNSSSVQNKTERFNVDGTKKQKYWTIQDYKENIRPLENEFYGRVVDWDGKDPLFGKELERMQRLKPKSKSTKDEYKRYYRELKYGLEWDTTTENGRRQLELREQKAYNTFKRKYGDIPYQEWRDLVETFGALGESMLNQFGSGTGSDATGDLVDTYIDARKQKNMTGAQFIKSLRKVNRLTKGMSFNTQEKLEIFREMNELEDWSADWDWDSYKE